MLLLARVHKTACFPPVSTLFFLLFIPLGATTTLLSVANATHTVKFLFLQATPSSPRLPLNLCLALSLAVAHGRGPS